MRGPPLVLPITPGIAGRTGPLGIIGDLTVLSNAGAGGVLIREPELSDAALLEVAMIARDLFSTGWVGVHDRVHVAIAAGADAVHLGYKSIPSPAVRTIAPSGLAIGLSQHAPELRDERMDADYRLVGPIFPTPSKVGLLDPIGAQALAGIPMPERTWAVGGIGPKEARVALDLGVAGVACIRSVFGFGDIRAGMNAMLEAVNGHE